MTVSRLGPDLIQELPVFFTEHNLKFFQLQSVRLYRRVCREALVNPGVVLFVAKDKSKITGFMLVLINKKKFVKKLLYSDPLLVWAVARQKIKVGLSSFLKSKRLGNNLANKAENPESHDPPKSLNSREYLYSPKLASWEEDNDKIAKVIMIFVAPGQRGTGTGLSLCQAVLKELEKKGVSRLDLLVNNSNISSLNMFKKIPAISFKPRGNDCFGSITVGEAE